MPQLVASRMHRTTKPELVVSNKLKAGKYRLRLVVVDDSGNQSQPTELEITVKAARRRNTADVIREGVVVNPAIRNRVVADGIRRRVKPVPAPKPPPSPTPSPPDSRARVRRRVRPTPVNPRRPTRR